MTQAVVVFGAYGGIGSHLCRRLSSHGAKLLMAGRDEVRLAELASELGGETFSLDVTDVDQVERCVERATESFGEITGVANCVGSLLLRPAHMLSELDWDTTISANLKSAFAVLRSSTRAMAQSGGSIVLISSAAARIGLPNHEAVSAAKAGIEGLALAAAASYASKAFASTVLPRA